MALALYGASACSYQKPLNGLPLGGFFLGVVLPTVVHARPWPWLHAPMQKTVGIQDLPVGFFHCAPRPLPTMADDSSPTRQGFIRSPRKTSVCVQHSGR